MKWKLPKLGDKRIIEKFLIFPKKIGYEKRWFETVKIRQWWNPCYGGWTDDCFID